MKITRLATIRDLQNALANVENPDVPLEGRLCLHRKDGETDWYPLDIVAREGDDEDKNPGTKVIFKESSVGNVGFLILTDSLDMYQKTLEKFSERG